MVLAWVWAAGMAALAVVTPAHAAPGAASAGTATPAAPEPEEQLYGPREPMSAAVRSRRLLDERFPGILRRTTTPPEFRQNRRGKVVHDDPYGRFRATVHPDGRMSFRDRGISIRARRLAGLSDLIMRAQGTELHQKAKRALLAETFEDRLAMRTDWTLDNLEDAERALWGELLEVWHDERLPLDERKRIVLERWAECDVDVDLSPVAGYVSTVDAQRRTVARRAQRTIEHFVRTQVPDPREFNFHRTLGDAGEPSTDLPRDAHTLVVALAPDLFEECELDPAACISVGDLLVGRRSNALDPEQGALYYDRGCEADDPWACYELAVLHYLGLGVARDDKRSADLHQVACEGGVAEGCAYLAHLRARGLGGPASARDAARYRAMACEHGFDDFCGR